MKKAHRKKISAGIKLFIVFFFILILVMYVYGMANTYFPNPILIGAGQYLDLSAGIAITGILFFGILLAIFFKKEMRKISNLKKI